MADKSKKPVWEVVLSTICLMAWVVTSILASQLALGYLMIWIVGAENFVMPVWTAVYSALSYLLAMVLIVFVPPKIAVAWKIVNEKNQDKKAASKKAISPALGREGLGLKGWPTWTDIGLAPVGFLVYLVAAAGITMLFSLFPWFDAGQAQDVGFSTMMSSGDRILAFLTLVVAAPIAEEIIFRGWLYGKLRKKFSHQMSNTAGMILAILLVSGLFGLVHMQWNVGVNVFALSVVACALREITGTIYSGILLHMIKNGVAFYILYVMGVG